MYQYKIAGLIINVESSLQEPNELMNQFLITQDHDADINISIKLKKYIDTPEGSIISDLNSNLSWFRKSAGHSGYYIYITNEEHFMGRILVLVDVDADWRNAVITCSSYYINSCFSEISTIKPWLLAHIMMGFVFRYSLIHLDGLIIHSSAITFCDKGILFSAPSGTGKSTHIGLWQKYLGDIVKVLNDDTPAVRIINHKPFVYGTPWSGSSFIHNNASAPLEAIIVLEQAQGNKIRRISGQEAILKLVPRVFLPYFDQNMMNITLRVFEQIISSVPIYSLQSRPDKEAMELVLQCVR